MTAGSSSANETLLAMETALRDRMTVGVARAAREAHEYLKTQYIETVFDEDRLPPMYKIFAMRWRVEG
ncbi:MAG: hypothetical protein WAW42_08490 [Candidatus Competibacteraceae bacterium]